MTTRPGRVTRWLMLMGAVALGLHLLTLGRYPQVWLDEVIFTDPAVNLAWQGRFTSTAWYFQSADAWWAANVPLYSWILAAWVQLGGLSPGWVRGLNLVLAAASACLLIAWPRRVGWLTSTRWTLWYAALVIAGHGMVVATRSGRYDVLGLLLCALLPWAATVQPLLWRRMALCLVAVLVPMAGLHVALYVGLMSLVWLAATRWRSWADGLAVLSGLALGGLALLALYQSQGVLADFLLNVRLSGYAGKKDWPRDPSLLLMLLAVIGLSWRPGDRAVWRQNSLPLVLCLAGVLVPAFIFLVARLPTFYAWMAELPLALGLAVWADRQASSAGPTVPAEQSAGRGLQGLMLLAVLTGLPLQTTLAGLLWTSRDPAALDAFVAQAGIADQVALIDPAAYYAVKPRARTTYLTMHDFSTNTDAQVRRNSVDVLIVDPDTQPELARQLGGQWVGGASYTPAPGPFAPDAWRWLAQRVSNALFGSYHLQIFRRVGEAPAAQALRAPIQSQ